MLPLPTAWYCRTDSFQFAFAMRVVLSGRHRGSTAGNGSITNLKVSCARNTDFCRVLVMSAGV
jgi:hypothetical protein